MLNGEENLIKHAIRGESSAFGSLYDEYQPRIYRFIYLKVGHREEAEDLTHQVFLNAWKNVKNYRFQGFPFSSWLYQIARNQVIDHYRTKKTAFTLDDNRDNEEENSNGDNFLTEDNNFNLDIRSEIAAVQEAIKKLIPEQQDVIIMRFVEEMPHREIAASLNKPESTVRVLQHRAIANLRKTLKNVR